MKTNKKTTAAVETKIVETTAKKLTIADVAREMNILPKRARSVLRKNAKLYNEFRKQRFDANSKQHVAARAALKQLFTA